MTGSRNRRPRRKETRREGAAARAALAPLKQEVRALEARIAKLTAERAELERRLADPATYAGNGAGGVVELQTKLAEVARRIAEAEEAWIDRHDALERAAGEV